MSWKKPFNIGITLYKAARYEDALRSFTQACESVDGTCQYITFDSRAAVYEKLGRIQDVLRDAKRTIDLAPMQWHGYSRAAKAFLTIRKLTESLAMIEKAISIAPAKRHGELYMLRSEILTALKQRQHQIAVLPIELYTEIFMHLVSYERNQLFPILLVCRHWNGVASSSPVLWDTLRLKCREPEWKAKRWVERSKGIIRELYLPRSLLTRDKWLRKDHLALLQWNRVQSCELEDWNLVEYMTKRAVSLLLDGLNKLHISDSPQGQSVSRDFFILHASDLQELTLEHAKFSWSTLSNHSNIRRLILRSPVIVPSPSSILDVAAARLIEAVHVPSLQSLRLFRETSDVSDLLSSIINRSGGEISNLVQLSIEECVVAFDVIMLLLRRSPLLQSLRLKGLEGTANKVLETMATSVALCPSLTNIDVSSCPDVATGPLVRLVKSRNATQTTKLAQGTEMITTTLPIHSLILDGCPNVDAAFLPVLRDLVPVFRCVYVTKKKAWRR
ncbi:hypothetical protein FISHEDRAFT_38465 [Fistulina hepatica ATCC 64428]|nr:hypothetical protein FISHEDRAFT_38465 [Fistulina hepatica ATCC 64428]